MNRRDKSLEARAERITREEMGWDEAQALDSKPAGRDGRATAVLMSTGEPFQPLFVLAFDDNGDLATDAGDPTDFGWEE